MNYEEKYKKALERARKDFNDENTSNYERRKLEVIFPELRESEDEKIRKGLIKGLSAMRDIHKHQTFSDDAINIDDAIAWLEKQGDYNKLVEEIKERKELISKEKEKVTSTNDKLSLGGRIAILEELLAFTDKKQDKQKPADKVEPKFKVGDTIKYVGEREEFSKEKHTIKEILDDCYLTVDDVYIPFKFEEYYILINLNSSWNEKDEKLFNRICDIINGAAYENCETDEDGKALGEYAKMMRLLKSLKNRVQPQPKKEWSEEDEYILGKIIHWAELVNPTSSIFEKLPKEQFIDWLNSLKPNHWKPSKEQMEALEHFVRSIGESGYTSPYDNNTKLIYSLLNNLKKL